MKILFIVPYTPTPIRTRPYNLLRTLARLGQHVTLATLWENEAEHDALDQFAKMGIKVIAERLDRFQIAKNLLAASLTGKPLQALYSWSPKLASKIVVNSKEPNFGFDIIHIEHLRGSIYGLHLKKINPGTGDHPAILWDSVDNISYLFEQASQHSKSGFGRWITRLELPRTRRYERYLAAQFQNTLVSSPLDREAYLALIDHSTNQPEMAVITNGVDLEYFTPPSRPRDTDTIVFSGKLSYHANVSSARFLVEQVMPLVWERRPTARVLLVGKDPHSSLRELARKEPRVHVTGTVPELREYLRQATVSAVTLTYGAGIQNKVLEAMACATPVVASNKAISSLQAVPGEDILVADEPGELAHQLLRIIEDPALQSRIGENGRRYVTQHHDWLTITQTLIAVYENIFDIAKNNPLF